MRIGGDSQFASANAARVGREERGVACVGVRDDVHKSRAPLAAGVRAPERRAAVPQIVQRRAAPDKSAFHVLGPELGRRPPLHTGGWYIHGRS